MRAQHTPAEYTVTLRFQFPAHDERDGLLYQVTADSKSAAIKQARRQADRDGHLVGRGRHTFKAEGRP